MAFEYIQDKTGLDRTKQLSLGALTLGSLYIGLKLLKNRIPSERTKSKGLNVLVIGASRGIGFSLTRQFLSFGDNVIIASSSQDSMKIAYDKLLGSKFFATSSQLFECQKCDVTQAKDLQNLYSFCFKTFKDNKIDIVINNFGISHKKRDFLWNQSCEEIQSICNVNVCGMLMSNKICIESVINSKQLTPIHMFNMCGAGTYGMKTPRNLTYGVSKGGYLNILKTLNEELKLAKLNDRIFLHSLQPGMAWTHLFSKEKNEAVISDPKAYKVVNALLEDVDVVTEWMVPRIRGVATRKRPRAAYEINFLTKTSVAARIAGGLLFGYNKERFIDKNGMAVTDTK